MILKFKKMWTITEQNFDSIIFDIVENKELCYELQEDARVVGIIDVIRDYCAESDHKYFMNWSYTESDISGQSPIIELFLMDDINVIDNDKYGESFFNDFD